MCDDSDAPHRHMIAYYYSVILITEGTLVTLAVWKALFGESYGQMIKNLTRDSVKFFVASVLSPSLYDTELNVSFISSILGFYIANQVVWLRNDVGGSPLWKLK